jgi:hypothetical protein
MFMTGFRQLLTDVTGILTFLLIRGSAPGAVVNNDPANRDLASYADRSRREFSVPGSPSWS